MVQKRHVSLILAAVILLLLAISWIKIPEAFASVQRSFVLNPDAATFSFEENSFNDSAVSNENNYLSAGNVTYWMRIPKNSTVSNATMNLTGKIIYVYSVQASASGIKGLAIGNVQGNENQISFGTLETDGKLKLLYGNNGSNILNVTVTSGLDVYSTSIGNVTSDAGSEIAVGSQDTNSLSLFYPNGTKIWEKSIGAVKSVKIADVYGNGINYTVAASNKVYVFNSSGGENWSTTPGCTIFDIAVGNFSSDSGNEIIVGCDSGKITILNSSGSVISNIWAGSSDITSVDIGNVTSDPGNEIAAGSADNKIYIINSSGGVVWNYSTGGYVSSVRIGDVTTQYPGNEVVAGVAGANDKKVYTLDNNGNQIWSFDAGSYIYTIGIGNLTSDTGNEVAAGAANGYLYVFNFDYFPDNVSIDVNGSAYDWSYSGKLRTAVIGGGTGAFISAIQSYLSICTAVSGMCTVPLLFHSDGPGKLNISGLNFTYSYNISNLVSAPTVSTWSRTRNINVNESVGNQTRNLSFLSNPSNDILVQYIRINQTATSCDFNGSSYTVESQEGQVVCNVPDFTIPASGALPGPFLLWDSNMSTGKPVLMSESAAYYTNYTDSFLWRKNLTIWNASATVIYNATANVSLDDAAVRGLEFLNITWKGAVCDLTPSAICPAAYTAKNCSGDIFYSCKQDTNSNGVYDFFKWVQPYSNSSVSYVTGGSTNLAANLSLQTVTPSQGIWGTMFNYSIYVNDTEGDSVNVTLWIMRNLSGIWERNSSQTVTGSGQLSFNVSSNISWVGMASYRFEYQDSNSSGYPIHSAQNSSIFTGPTVSKHNTSLVVAQGNNSEVNRNSSVFLSVRINDTEIPDWTGANVSCVFWVTTNGARFDAGHYNATNSSGYCNYLFTPDAGYAAGNQTWKAGIWNDTYYADSNSTNFTLTVKGRINTTLVSPGYNQTLLRNSTNMLIARMLDEYGRDPSTDVSGYNCTFWFLNQSGANNLGNATTNSSGWCTMTWSPNCSVTPGQFTVNVTLAGSSQFYSIQGSESDTQILMKDVLQVFITNPTALSSFHKGNLLTMNSSANDTCLLCGSSDYQTTWNIKFKQFLQVNLNETRGFPRVNETIIINASELESEGIDLSDWRINYTKVIYNGQEIPSEIKAWTDGSKSAVNATQVFLNNYSELVFLANIPALQAATYIVYYNESSPADWNISYILNGGFESGSLSPWSCANSSDCTLDQCDCRVTTGDNETAGNYSLRMLVVPSSSFTNISVQQSVNTGINSSYIKIRYKPVNMTSNQIRLSAGSGVCNLSTQPEAWTETLCYNTSFQNAANISLAINSTGKDGSYRYLYIDYICIADSSGNCTSMDSGYSPRRILASQTAIGSGNTSWQVPVNETLGMRRLLANSSGQNHVQNFSVVSVYLFGWSNVSMINLSSGYCTYNQTFQCMSNATIDYYCITLDLNTSQGIHNYNVSFFMNGSYMGSNMTNASGYAVFRNSTGKGNYNISCNISDTIYEPNTYYNITSNNGASMTVDVISGNTTANVSLSPLAQTTTGITRESNYTFYLNVTVNNTGNGSMFSPVISISSPAGIFVQPMSCPTLMEGSSCSSSLQADVSQSALVSPQTINITAAWSNADSTQGNATNQTSVTVENHTALNITQAQLNMSIVRGDSKTAGNFTVEAYGNTPLSLVTFSLSGGNASAISGWITYTPSTISAIPKAGTNTTLINLSIPVNATEGVYMTTLIANATGSSCSPASECWDSLPMLINVTPPDWDSSPANLSKTIGMNASNDSIGIITVTNNKNQNYSFSVSVTGSSYVKTDKPSLNMTGLSTGYVYVYHNKSGSSYTPGYWSANVTITNQDSGAFPHSMSISVNLSVIETNVDIISPNQTSPTSAISAGDRINITANATRSGLPATSGMNWTATVGGQACGDMQSSYNPSTEFWDMNCTAPNITGNPIYNTLTVTGIDIQQGGNVSDQETNAVRYQDITPPQISNISISPVNYYSSAPYILINATITDNTLVNSSWLVITQPNGTNATVGSPVNTSSLYTFNFSNPNAVGDYDIYVFANDSYGYTNSTKGWFDVYKPFTISGLFTDPNSANLSANFTFYRPGSSTIIHQFSTNSSQSSYNWSVHDRVYDVRLSLSSHTITLYGVNTTTSAISEYGSPATNVSGAFRFDNYPNLTSPNITRISLPNTAWHRIMAFAIETPNLSYSNASITIDYSSARDIALPSITDLNENNLRVFRCSNWNFFARTCSDAGGTFSLFNESLVPAGGTFSFTATPSTAYAIAEWCNGNICGQSQQQPPPSGGGTPSTGGGGTAQPVCGNGKCETGENSQNCPKDCPAELEFPLIIKTGITNIRLRPGDKATYPFSLTNRLNSTVTADISVSGLDKYFTLEKTSVDIGSNKTETFNIYVTVPETIETGTYTGTITVSARGKTKDIPVTMIIGLEGKSQLNLVLTLLTKSIQPNGELKYTVEIRNVGFGANVTLGMVYTVRNAISEEIIKQENETLNFSLATGESYTFNKVMDLKDVDIPVGQYYLEAVASFDHRFVRDIETFEVSQIFWASPFGQFVSWFVIVGAIVTMAFYERRRYNRWKMKKSRYLFPVNYTKIPQQNEDAFWIGRIAETEKKAWFNPNDLTTHVLIAGSTGAGKSVSASVFVEEALDKKIPVVVFDPTAQWTGFVKQCEDENLLRYYRQFGMDVRYTKPYKGMIFEITDPHVIIDFKKYMNPGEITVFTMNKLGPGEYDVAVKNIINAIFKTGWEESTKLKMIMVFDEVHRLLEKYGGIGGYISLEQACREFRKWGISIIMCSQVLADFKEAIAGNVLTDIQMNTKSLIDIRKVETKYGPEYATRISRQGVGVGMMQNPKYNEGKPYFVQFRPTWHNPHKITDEEMSFYKEFAQRLELIERRIESLKASKKDVTDIEIELKLAKDKLKQGRFRMAKIYINSLEEHLNIKQETPK